MPGSSAVPPIEKNCLAQISTWDFNLLDLFLHALSKAKIIDDFDITEVHRVKNSNAILDIGPDRYCYHYRIFDEVDLGEFTIEDKQVGAFYKYEHQMRGRIMPTNLTTSEMDDLIDPPAFATEPVVK